MRALLRDCSRFTLVVWTVLTASAPLSPTTRADERRTLIRNAALILTMDPSLGQGELGLLADADVLIEGDTIVAVGQRLPQYSASVVDAAGKIVMPGFVDTHKVQPATETARVQQDVRALNHALYNADVETVMRYTHPSVIAMLGGIQSARKMVQEAVLFIKSTGLRVESLTFPRPPDFLEAGGRRFAVIPTLSILSANGQRLESLNFQLGILEPDSTEWTYVEGSRLTKENVQSLFPGFPATYQFPPFYRKKL